MWLTFDCQTAEEIVLKNRGTIGIRHMHLLPLLTCHFSTAVEKFRYFDVEEKVE